MKALVQHDEYWSLGYMLLLCTEYMAHMHVIIKKSWAKMCHYLVVLSTATACSSVVHIAVSRMLIILMLMFAKTIDVAMISACGSINGSIT